MVCIPTENHGEAGEVDYIEVSGLPYDYTNNDFMDLAARSDVGLMIEEVSLEQSNTPGVFRINFFGTIAPSEELEDWRPRRRCSHPPLQLSLAKKKLSTITTEADGFSWIHTAQIWP